MADRGVAKVFAATLKATLPLPAPVAPLLIATQAAPLDAVQLQPPGEVTASVPLPPAAATDCDVGVTPNVQAAPTCVTTALWPPTLTVALRATDDAFGSAMRATIPFPEPVPPPVIRNHVALLDAVHEQPFATVTLRDPVPPPTGVLCVAGERPNEQGAALCVIVIVKPATVSEPTRALAAGLAVAAKVTDPFPVPDAPADTVSQAEFEAAVHAHPAVDVTDTLPPPAVPAIVDVSGVAANVQGTENMKVFDTALALVPPGPTAATRDS